MRVAIVGSCSVWQHICDSSFASSRFCGAIAATFVVAFVELAAFAFVHSATACGLYDPAGGSCFQPGGAATLAALLAFSFVFVLLWSMLQVDAFDGDFALVGVFWCLVGDITVHCSSGSYIAVMCISSLCAFVGDFLSQDGIQCFLDGVIAVAGLAHVLVGVYWICRCNSSCTGIGPRSSCSAFVEFASVLSILKLGGLWFLAGPFRKAKEFVSCGNSRSYSRQASGFDSADIGAPLIKGSGEHGIVSSLPEGLGQASGRVDVPDDAKVEAAAAFGSTLIPFGYLADFVVDRTMLTFLDSGSVPIVMLRGVGQCVVIATGVEHPGPILLLLDPAPWNAGRNRGRSKGPLGRDPPPGPSNVPPTAREPRVVPPRGPPGAGAGTPPRDTDSAVLPGKLLGALKLLQTVMSAEDFSKYEKLVAPPSKEERTKEREQLLWEKVQSQNRLRKQEAGHVEQIAKLAADAAKQRAMLQSVREQLEAVNDEVCALRALVADPSVPTGPTPEPPPLPAPRTPPPPSQDLLDIATPLDQDMEDCEDEKELEWPPVRRFSHLERHNNIGVIKGFTKHRREKSLPATKHVILEDDMLTENMGKEQSGKEIADMLCNMSHEKLLEVVQNCPASMLQQFVPNVSAAIAPAVVEIPASSSG